MKWEILSTKVADVIPTLLKNRGLVTKKQQEDFLNPRNPNDISLSEYGIKKGVLDKIVKRLKKALKQKEKIIVFGDYDADGVCSTAILWETLFSLGLDVLPYIPDRFGEGYGLKAESFKLLKEKYPDLKLVITVDNGVVAYEGIDMAAKMKIDVIVVDHHLEGEKENLAYAIFHSTLICGSALSWILCRELVKAFDGTKINIQSLLELAAIGTIADQMSLLDVNRSIVKFGLIELKKTKRLGLKSLFLEAGINIQTIGVYEIGFLIAPRINAMGRLAHAIDSLRLICTRDGKKAAELSRLLNETNTERQKIVDEVIKEIISLSDAKSSGVLVVKGHYHEGVIGLASGKITDKFYRPSIVFSVGERISKASARSIAGFNIIEVIKKTGLILEGGGHPMAAGFSIETQKIEEFSQSINNLSKDLLTVDLLERKLKVDLELDFEVIDKKLVSDLKQFEPFGPGNYAPLFATEGVNIKDLKIVGSDGKHLKLKVSKDKHIFDAIAFGLAAGNKYSANDQIAIAYSIEENVWNGRSSIQLKIKDIKG